MKSLFFLVIVTLFTTSDQLFPSIIDQKHPFERFISLGNCCVTRRQINYHLSSRFNADQHSFGGGHIFDWMFMHDYSKLTDAIQNNLDDVFIKENMNGCYNVKYNMGWIHLFEDSTTMDQVFPLKKQKMDYLAQKFRELALYRTLYIIAFPHHYDGCDGMNEPDKNTLKALYRSIKNMRGNDNFVILYLPHRKKFESTKNIIVYEMPSVGRVDGGDTHKWDKILSKFPFKYPAVMH